MEENKSLKQYCREAKNRLKTGFWKDYGESLGEKIKTAERAGIAVEKIKEYCSDRVSETIKKKSNEEDFYKKVKALLDNEGEVSDAIGRLTDKEYFDRLSYDEKQRYTMSLSERYLRALDRYKKEKELKIEA